MVEEFLAIWKRHGLKRQRPLDLSLGLNLSAELKNFTVYIMFITVISTNVFHTVSSEIWNVFRLRGKSTPIVILFCGKRTLWSVKVATMRSWKVGKIIKSRPTVITYTAYLKQVSKCFSFWCISWQMINTIAYTNEFGCRRLVAKHERSVGVTKRKFQ